MKPLININNLYPILQSNSFPFLEKTFDDIDEYAILARIQKAVNEIITNNNTLNDNFTELNNYVTDYFKNLDVQDEIDNKLQQMAEDGTLANIINQEIFGDLNQKVDSNTSKIEENTNNITELTTIVNNLKVNKWINPLDRGAKGDGITDDYSIIQDCINEGNVILSSGSYYISQPIIIPSNRVFEGGNCKLISEEDQYAIKLEGNGIDNPITQVAIKNLNIDTKTKGGNGISIKDTYFIYIDNINIIQLKRNNAIGFNIQNGFNHVISNSRVYGDYQNYNNQIGINIIASGDAISNMTNCIYDTILLQNMDYGVKTNYSTTANQILFNNIGFSSCKYAFYLSGNAQPINITNTRIEGSNRDSVETIYGFYILDNILANISNLNIYNINVAFYLTSDRQIILNGAMSFTGTVQSTLYKLFDDACSSSVNNNANIYVLTNVYSTSYKGTGSYINGNYTIGRDNTSNSLQMDNLYNKIVKQTVNITNVFGSKGSFCYIWTDQENISISGTGASITNKWSGDITLEKYKLYLLYMIESNQCIISA